MRYHCWTLLSVPLLAVAVGCGDANKTNETAAQGTTNAGQAAAAPEAGGPVEAVTQFLEAVRTGNDDVATKMFTPLARQKASELGIQVAPRGSDTARFEVGSVEMLGADGARVASKWSDLNKNGQTRTDEITWMLRRETEGWRVAGMAAVVFEGEPPLLLDFEQPEETMKRLDMLREEVQRRMAKDDAAGQRNQASQPIQPAEHVAETTSTAIQPLQTAAKEDVPLQRPVENAIQGTQQTGANPPQGADKGAREAQRSADPFLR